MNRSVSLHGQQGQLYQLDSGSTVLGEGSYGKAFLCKCTSAVVSHVVIKQVHTGQAAAGGIH